MGLDGVELVLDWEERFEMAIADEDAANLLTPRQAIDYIFAALPKSLAATCLTQRAFYRARNALLGLSTLERSEISPRSRLEHLIPRQGRRSAWKTLAERSGLSRWPMLRRPAHVTTLAWVLPILVGLTAYALNESSVAISFAIASVGLLLSFFATIPLATEFSREIPTVGGLARFLALHNAADVVPSDQGWTRSQVRDVVRDSIVNVLGVSADFDDNAEFVRDLGVS
jgi:acyl carrier protein